MVEKSKRFRWRFSSDNTFDLVNTLLCAILLLVFVWPLYFVVIASFSDPAEVWSGNVILFPKGFTLTAYETLMEHKQIWIGYRNSIFYTAFGTCLAMVMTVLCAFPLSRRELLLKGFFTKFCLIPMYFSGGLIPTYLVIKSLGMVNTPWVMIVPGCLSFYNALIVRSYFTSSIPGSLEEAAELDGASPVQYLLKVVLPLSKPVLAVVTLYYAVGIWNNYTTALVYIYDSDLFPLQTVLREVLVSAAQLAGESTVGMSLEDALTIAEKMQLAQILKYSSIVVSIIPMMIVYPFVQKYFVKGVMIGAIKG